jgi:hypothetical protein
VQMINVDGTYIHICLVFVLRVLEVRGKRDRKLKTCMYGDGICHQQLSIAARLRVEAFSCQRWCICDSCPCCHPRLLTFFQRGCQRQQTTALLEGIRDHDGMIISFLSSIYDQLAWIYLLESNLYLMRNIVLYAYSNFSRRLPDHYDIDTLAIATGMKGSICSCCFRLLRKECLKSKRRCKRIPKHIRRLLAHI